MRANLAALSLLVSVLSAPPVFADPLEDAPPPARRDAPVNGWALHPWSLEGHLGMATPVGEVGMTAEYAPLPEVGVGFGVGTNLYSPVVGALVRARPLHGYHNALVLSAAYSAGGYQEPHFDLGMGHSSERRTVESGFAHWAQVDAGWELRTAGGFVLRTTYGAAWMLNPGDVRCTDYDTSAGTSAPCDVREHAAKALPTFEVSIGWAM